MNTETLPNGLVYGLTLLLLRLLLLLLRDFRGIQATLHVYIITQSVVVLKNHATDGKCEHSLHMIVYYLCPSWNMVYRLRQPLHQTFMLQQTDSQKVQGNTGPHLPRPSN